VLFGTLPLAIALTAWFWPKTKEPTLEPSIS
jgi:hypothetical protein